MIVGNIRTEPLDSVHRESSSLDSAVYLPQRDRSTVLLVLVAEQKHQNESNMAVQEAHIMAPKTVSDKIDRVSNFNHALCLKFIVPLSGAWEANLKVSSVYFPVQPSVSVVSVDGTIDGIEIYIVIGTLCGTMDDPVRLHQ